MKISFLQNATFQNPEYIWVFPLIIIGLYISKKRSTTVATANSNFLSLTNSLSKDIFDILRVPIISILGTITLACVTLALMRPQNEISVSQNNTSAKDIVLVLDVSPSMEAIDFQQDGRAITRLQALKGVVTDFIKRRDSDRISLVVFGSEVFVQAPLSLDHQMALQFLDQLESNMAGPGTAIGDALTIGLKRVIDFKSDSKVIILVSDGDDNASSVPAHSAAEIAEKHKIKVHTIAIGQGGKTPFVRKGAFGMQQVVYEDMQFDEKLLKDISQTTDGQSFNASSLETLKTVYDQIDKLEAREDLESNLTFKEELAPTFIAAAIASYLILLLLNISFYKIVP